MCDFWLQWVRVMSIHEGKVTIIETLAVKFIRLNRLPILDQVISRLSDFSLSNSLIDGVLLVQQLIQLRKGSVIMTFLGSHLSTIKWIQTGWCLAIKVVCLSFRYNGAFCEVQFITIFLYIPGQFIYLQTQIIFGYVATISTPKVLALCSYQEVSHVWSLPVNCYLTHFLIKPMSPGELMSYHGHIPDSNLPTYIYSPSVYSRSNQSNTHKNPIEWQLIPIKYQQDNEDQVQPIPTGQTGFQIITHLFSYHWVLIHTINNIVSAFCADIKATIMTRFLQNISKCSLKSLVLNFERC